MKPIETTEGRWQILILLLLSSLLNAGEANEKPWSVAQADVVLDKTLRLHLAPDLSGLTESERGTIDLLLQVGEIMHQIYLDSLHPEYLAAGEALQTRIKTGIERKQTKKLAELFYLFKGGYATTLENKREPFLDIGPEEPGRNMYPQGANTESLDRWMKEHPKSRQELMATRTVVRRAKKSQLATDLTKLEKHSYLEVLHPGLQEQLAQRAHQPDGGYYAIPYALAWAEELQQAAKLLMQASKLIATEDADLAAYLANRGRDLLSNDYESGDASWVTGRFKRINAQIGAYETYDDKLYGVKAAYSMSILMRDSERSQHLRSAIKGIQALEDSLPYEHHKKVREDLPVGVYQVIADFGQARGTNTATILPNDANMARKYGRTILLRHNILTHPELYKITESIWRAAVLEKHAGDLTMNANFNRTLFHEIGHYLGPATDKQGRSLSEAMGKYSDHIEELKADLVSLYLVPQLAKMGYYSTADVKAVYAAGIYRTLQKVQPRISQPYQTMQLMQFNFYLASPLLTFKPGHGARLEINYEHYHETVHKMLKQVLQIQHEGDPEKAAHFIMGLSMWSKWLHEDLALNLSKASTYRYRLPTYAVLEP